MSACWFLHTRQGGSNVTNGHDSRQFCVALHLADVVNQGSSPTGIDDQLSKLWSVLGHFTNARGSILPYKSVVVFQTIENVREYLRLDNYFSQIDGVLCDLR